MEVILLEDVAHLGSIGSLVKVAPGYGRNKLLPEKLAILASVKNKSRLEHEKRLANFRRIKAEAVAKAQAQRLGSVSVTIARKVGDQDKLFGSVTAQDIQLALAAQGIELDRRKLQLAEPIRAIGDYKVAVRLGADVRTEVTVLVRPET